MDGIDVKALRGVDIAFSAAIYGDHGASGSGKSTLMNILGCLDKPTRGQYLIEGRMFNLEP
jgi:putative ABC transport system ATP-binding protein